VSDVTSLLDAVAEHLTREEFEVTGSGYDIPEFGRTVAAFSVLPANACVIPRGKFIVAGDLLRIEVQLDTKTPKGQIKTCQLQGSGHIRATFATLEYSLTQGTATIWGGRGFSIASSTSSSAQPAAEHSRSSPPSKSPP
jgi:hypothetical protein